MLILQPFLLSDLPWLCLYFLRVHVTYKVASHNILSDAGNEGPHEEPCRESRYAPWLKRWSRCLDLQ